MSESKHTPGKWRLRTEHPAGGGPTEIIIGTEEREILRVRANDANIHDFILMVRAPDLYEAAKEVRDILRSEGRVFLADRLRCGAEGSEVGRV